MSDACFRSYLAPEVTGATHHHTLYCFSRQLIFFTAHHQSFFLAAPFQEKESVCLIRFRMVSRREACLGHDVAAASHARNVVLAAERRHSLAAAGIRVDLPSTSQLMRGSPRTLREHKTPHTCERYWPQRTEEGMSPADGARIKNRPREC